ncbi:MAG TPA: TetR/AcrR family transcriptional regulator [Candidatus Binatia bacterium]|nr:TetR/AcrR family transcriptional regulator [Candidatus Binatia bacterium]
MPPAPTQQAILAAAHELFLDGGVEGLTMRAVAKRVGVTPMAIYRHFDGWNGLLAAVADRGHATFMTYLQQALAESSPAARLMHAGTAYVDFALEHPRDYAGMFVEPLGRDMTLPPRWRDVATFRFLVDRLQECAGAGLLELDDPETAALTVWANAHGLVSLFLAGKLGLSEPDFRALYARSMQTLLTAWGWSRPTTRRRIRSTRRS